MARPTCHTHSTLLLARLVPLASQPGLSPTDPATAEPLWGSVGPKTRMRVNAQPLAEGFRMETRVRCSTPLSHPTICLLTAPVLDLRCGARQCWRSRATGTAISTTSRWSTQLYVFDCRSSPPQSLMGAGVLTATFSWLLCPFERTMPSSIRPLRPFSPPRSSCAQRTKHCLPLYQHRLIRSCRLLSHSCNRS